MMNHDEHRPTPPPSRPAAGPKRVGTYGWILIALAAIGLLFYLITDHGSHLPAALPYIGIIGVVVAHLFMHKGHSHGGQGSPDHDHGTSEKEKTER